MSLRELLESGSVRLSILPDDNDYLLNADGKTYRQELIESDSVDTWHSLSPAERARFYDLAKLDALDGYTVPIIAHDYKAMTPKMWNAFYRSHGLKLGNVMVVGEKERAEHILSELLKDPKYMGGGAGVGFKEVSIDAIYKLGGEARPSDLKAVNILVNEHGKLVGYNTDADGLLRAIEERLSEIPSRDGTGYKSLAGSNVILLGARGVGKEVARRLAKKGIRHLTIVNRTAQLAVDVAHEINLTYRVAAEGIGEHLLRGAALNSWVMPDVIINATEKGSDGLAEYSAFGFANPPDKSKHSATEYERLKQMDVGTNGNVSRQILRELVNMNTDVLVSDVVLPPKTANGGMTTTLRHVVSEWERKGATPRVMDGTRMVVYQAVDAYKLIEKAWPGMHGQESSENEIRRVMANAAGLVRPKAKV